MLYRVAREIVVVAWRRALAPCYDMSRYRETIPIGTHVSLKLYIV